jgi:branched-chain amino acid aminotransferase
MTVELKACPWAFINRELVPAERAVVPADNHALHYGTAALESLRVYQTPEGPNILGFEQHLERLRVSLRSLGGKEDQTSKAREAVLRTIKENKLVEGYLRVLAYPAGDCARLDHSAYPVDILVLAWRIEGPRHFPPLTLGISSLRRPPAGSWLPRAKLSGFYAVDASVHISCREEGFDDALMLHADGTVCEVTGANIFLVKDGRLHTPIIPHSIAGITRQLVCELARSLELPVEQTMIPLEDFIAADEVFITGTFHGIRSISAISRFQFPVATTPGPITRAIQERFEKLLETPDSEEGRAWLTPAPSIQKTGARHLEGSTQIRQARLNDTPGILSGIGALLSELRAIPSPAPPATESLCRRIITGETGGAIFVGTPLPDNERIIGILGLSVQEALHLGGKYALIQELWVDPDYRSAGVGTSLIDACVRYCQENELHTLEVCLPRYQVATLSSTQKFYESCGFVGLGPRMRKEVV